MLPLVARIVDDIVRTYREVHGALEAFEQAKRTVNELDGVTQKKAALIEAERELRYRDEDVAEALDRFQLLIEEIEALGGTVKDYETGAVDFYGEVDGEIVYLSWQPGDERVAHWHRLEDGHSQRMPLPASLSAR